MVQNGKKKKIQDKTKTEKKATKEAAYPEGQKSENRRLFL